jgi:hypothetical protein
MAVVEADSSRSKAQIIFGLRSALTFRILDFGFWILDFLGYKPHPAEFWILDFKFWI